jgi:hypothetical protein|tara:strand:- start:1560 stop:1769 length:210 start_codon:yes stop_codon:yes gene_type:complete
MKIQFKLKDADGNDLVLGVETNVKDLIINGISIVSNGEFKPETLLDVEVSNDELPTQNGLGVQGELELQ